MNSLCLSRTDFVVGDVGARVLVVLIDLPSSGRGKPRPYGPNVGPGHLSRAVGAALGPPASRRVRSSCPRFSFQECSRARLACELAILDDDFAAGEDGL